jgi:hypothetical protein
MRTASSRWLCLSWAARSPTRWVLGCSSVAGRRNMFIEDGGRKRMISAASTTPATTLRNCTTATRSTQNARPPSSGPVSPLLLAAVLARIEPPPPQRVMGCIDWTPSCRGSPITRQYALDQPSRPGSSFTVSVHLQTHARNTHQPPILISTCR